MRKGFCKGGMIGLLCAAFLSLPLTSAGAVEVGVQVIGGEPVPEGEYPFLVSLQQEGLHWCTATLISPDQLLTARHCTHPSLIPQFTAIIGRSQLSASGGEERKIVHVRNHPEVLDVSVLTLDRPVHSVQPVALGEVGADPSGGVGIVAGWGAIDDDFNRPDWLQRASVPILPKPECALIHADGFIEEGELCAGSAGAGACFGDSGGALLQEVDGAIVQVGVVSRGRDLACAKNIGGAAFTDTTSAMFRTWLGPYGRNK